MAWNVVPVCSKKRISICKPLHAFSSQNKTNHTKVYFKQPDGNMGREEPHEKTSTVGFECYLMAFLVFRVRSL